MNKIIHLAEIQSTNSSLKEMLQKEPLVDEGTVVYADFQTAGRGQRENSWESAKGKNLTFSMVLYPTQIHVSSQFLISQVVAVTLSDYLNQLTGGDITIKWPNDIYWKNKKIAGVLIENVLLGDTISQSVIGIGLNVNQEEFIGNAPNPVSLKQITSLTYDLHKMISELSALLIQYYQKTSMSEKDSLVDHYKQSLFRFGVYASYKDETGEFMARIRDVEETGLLLLETVDGELRRYAFKEVSYII